MFISDDKAIVNLIGLRCVIKSDQSWGDEKEYHLLLSYKRNDVTFRYKLPEERNAMFDKLSEALATKG